MTVPRYAVFGHPIAHSKSPQIHRLFAAQEGVSIEYERILADNSPAAFQAAVTAFFDEGGCGANVTLPFKETACGWADDQSERARAAAAANTLVRQADGRILADNTDGIGLVQDLIENLGMALRGRRILLLGAGGAARGVVLPLLAQQPAALTIANRTHTKAEALAAALGAAACPFADLAGQAFDIIINATSGSLDGRVPEVPAALFSGCRLAYDMFYGTGETAFMRFARQHGTAQTADGLGMLVGQAAASYALWRGFKPAVRPVIDHIRRETGR